MSPEQPISILGSGGGPALTVAISAAMVKLYAKFYAHDRTTATTYINDKIVVCVVEDILSDDENRLVAGGAHGEVIDGRAAFQAETEDEFTAAVERLTNRHVAAFLSANQTTPGVACELFFLDTAPGSEALRCDLALMAEPSTTVPDGELLAGMDVDGLQAFQRVYDRYCDRAYPVALSICRDEGRAQEAVQDAFVAIWTNRARYDPRRGNVAAWLLTVVRYRAIDLIRHDQQHAIRRANEAELERTVTSTDMAQAAIARATGLSAGTVKGRMRLGLQKLRRSSQQDPL